MEFFGFITHILLVGACCFLFFWLKIEWSLRARMKNNYICLHKQHYDFVVEINKKQKEEVFALKEAFDRGVQSSESYKPKLMEIAHTCEELETEIFNVKEEMVKISDLNGLLEKENKDLKDMYRGCRQKMRRILKVHKIVKENLKKESRKSQSSFELEKASNEAFSKKVQVLIEQQEKAVQILQNSPFKG